jgi:hypothetical protein
MHVYNQALVRNLNEAVDSVRQALEIRSYTVRRAAFDEALKELVLATDRLKASVTLQ